MYFEDVELYSLKNINCIEELYAHTGEVKNETLEEHLRLVYKYFMQIIDDSQLDRSFKKLESIFFDEKNEITGKLWKEMICNTIYMHDVGKANADFQCLKMQNTKFKQTKTVNSKHSMLSALIYINFYYEKLKMINGKIEGKEMNRLVLIMMINAYLISKHHGSLEVFSEFKHNLARKLKDYKLNSEGYEGLLGKIDLSESNIKYLLGLLENDENMEETLAVDLYVYSKLMYSLLIAADFYATYSFGNNTTINSFGRITKDDQFYETYTKTSIYINIRRYEKYIKGKGDSPFIKGHINELRCELFIEAEENLLKNMDKNIFYMEAPTGSGKTNTSINLALQMMKEKEDLNKIYYVFPFNNLVEQTKESLYKIFEDKSYNNKIAVINSITPIITDNEDSKMVFHNKEINYEKALLDRQFLHYPIVLTTHVGFFDILFGVCRSRILPLCHLANSIIIIDEIQSYKNEIWQYIILFFEKYADILNIKLIIMSATLPKLGELIDRDNSFCQLINNRDRYYADLRFRERVKVDYILLKEETIDAEVLMDKIIEVSKNNTKKILIEFIRNSSATNFFELLNSNEGIGSEVLLMTGDDSKIERKKIIRKLHNQDNLILVATQVIEAGVDIDMDIGFKNISFIDAEEQFLGRINRSCTKSGSVMYPFLMDEVKKIYRKDFRANKEVSLLKEDMREILSSKNFKAYYKIIFEKLKKYGEAYNENNYKQFIKENILGLDFKEVCKKMRLINERQRFTVFLSRKIEMENGKIIDGCVVWETYEKLLMNKDMAYAERKVKLSSITEKLDYFTYDVDYMEVGFDCYMGGIFYISEGEQYLNNGKIIKKKFTKDKYEIL